MSVVSLSQEPEDRQTILTGFTELSHITSHFSPIKPRHEDDILPLITSNGQCITTNRMRKKLFTIKLSRPEKN